MPELAMIVLVLFAGGMFGLGMTRPRWAWASSRWVVLGRFVVMVAIVAAMAAYLDGKESNKRNKIQVENINDRKPAGQDQINKVIARYKDQASENGFAEFSDTITAIMTADGSAEIDYTFGGTMSVEIREQNPGKELLAQLGESTGRVLRAIPQGALKHIESLSIHTVIRSTRSSPENVWINATTARWDGRSLRRLRLAELSGMSYFDAADNVTIMAGAISQARALCKRIDLAQQHIRICADVQ